MPKKVKPFDPKEELKKIRDKKSLSTRYDYKKKRSLLEDFHGEIVKLRQNGGTYEEIATWLFNTHKIEIHSTSIMRYIKKYGDI